MRDIEQKFKNAAELYAKNEGEALLEEAAGLRRRNVSYLTPRADRAVRELASKRKRPRRRNALLGFAGAAACIIIAVRLISGVPGAMSGGGSIENAAQAPPVLENLEKDVAASGAFGQEIIPISFVLPAGYEITSADFDNGMSVYALENEARGAVVLTMYYADEAGAAPGMEDGFGEIIIDGASVPAKVNDAYKLLAFESGGLQYTLSSEDDLGALAAFYRSIAV